MAYDFDLERFCKRLHGNTGKEIEREVESQINILKEREKSDARDRRGRRKGDMTFVPYDAQKDIESLERLMEVLIHGYSQSWGQIPEELELFREVRAKMKIS